MFGRRVPRIARQLASDVARPACLEAWGTSANFDENARATIVQPAILDEIGRRAGVVIRDGEVCHAGLLHTYGYLFSTLETPYGYKRERWLQPTIERGLRLETGVLQAIPVGGTLLANVTCLLAHLALADRPIERAVLRDEFTAVPPSLRNYDYAQLDVRRLTETVKLPGSGHPRRTVRLITDLVAMSDHAPAKTVSGSLLVYSAEDDADGRRRLITAFAMQTCATDLLLANANFGSRQSIRPRYNCVVAGFGSEPRIGTRRLQAWEFH